MSESTLDKTILTICNSSIPHTNGIYVKKKERSNHCAPYYIMHLYRRFARQHILVILQILGKKCRRIQIIGTMPLTLVTVQALFNLPHLLLPYIPQIVS